ncbi:MAG TPA: alpha/beta fold hydrolase [Actinomycetota bacterium]|nr:alpha/beta fold hydrolase [Actinomycetota bacterium]
MRRSIPATVALLVALSACTLGGPRRDARTITTSAPLPPGVTIAACGPAHADRCGTIEVPLYRDGSSSRTIDVHFRVFEHTDRTAPVQEPIVAFEGGPGYSTIDSAPYYEFLFGPLLATHDLILMDQRGTGRSGAIACPELQQQTGTVEDASAACARRLGDAANAYGSAATADDLVAILDALGVWRVDLYGDSYGTYLAQVFALRHPNRTRAVVLDGTYDDSFDPLARDAAASLRHSFATVCARAGTCPGILAGIARFERQLEERPLVGRSEDADGTPVDVRLTPASLAQLLYDATYTFVIYRDFPAALAAYERGDDAPMLRLAAEDLGSTGPGNDVEAYSEGADMAVSCHDYPVVWDRAASPAERQRQLDQTLDALSPAAFAPLSNQAWLNSTYEVELVDGCLRWPPPRPGDDTITPTKVPHPHLPVLVLNGEFDITTPPSDARAAADAWPDATYVELANEVHVTAMYDYEGCASAIARRFLRTLETGPTSCARRTPQIPVVPVFPITSAQAPKAISNGPGDASTPQDRQVAWAAGEAVGDALTRWWNLMYGPAGHGLRGGTFTVQGPYLSYAAPLRLTLEGVRFVDDVAVSGTVIWHRRAGRVEATLTVEAPSGSGDVTLTFGTNHPTDTSQLRGVLGGRRISVRLPPLWAT